MKKFFRDSWEVWRAKVNAALGTVEQIDASEVLFDNDNTDLTANDVQEAIEEVNSKANTIALDISQLSASHIGFEAGETGMTAENVQEAIEELNGVTSKLNNCYVTSAVKASFSSNGDGIKTFSDCLADLASQMLTACAALADDEAIVPNTLFVGTVAWMGIIGKDVFYNTIDSIGCVFSRCEINATACNIWFARLNDTNPTLKGCSIGTTPTVAISSFENNVPADGTLITLYYDKIKKIS